MSFRFALDEEEKRYLKELARWSIESRFKPGGATGAPEPPTNRLRETFGAFVTLKRQGQLRGCIGYVVGDKPLYQTIHDMAQNAAFKDPRFPPLEMRELDDLEIEISILSPLERCPDPERIEIGRHGLMIVHKGYSGLLLPQVPVEWGWDRLTFLKQVCLKAGLKGECWKDKHAALFWFEAEIF